MSREQIVARVPLWKIQISHNPRRPAANLQDNMATEGYEGKKLIDLVHELALSEDPKNKKEFVRLFETYEAGPRDILELAASRREIEQQPILLRRYRKGGQGDSFFGIVVGERRILAHAYNHAKHGDPADIGAIVKNLTVGRAEDIAFDENLQRKDMTALEIGQWIRAKYESRKAEVKQSRRKKKTFSLKELAEERGMDYQYTLSRMTLTYLPENLQLKVASGKLGLTKASQIGREIRNGKRNADGSPKSDDQAEPQDKKTKRDRSKTLKELREVFDENRHEHDEFLRGLSVAMNLKSLTKAKRESDKRIKEAEKKELAEAAELEAQLEDE